MCVHMLRRVCVYVCVIPSNHFSRHSALADTCLQGRMLTCSEAASAHSATLLPALHNPSRLALVTCDREASVKDLIFTP